MKTAWGQWKKTEDDIDVLQKALEEVALKNKREKILIEKEHGKCDCQTFSMCFLALIGSSCLIGSVVYPMLGLMTSPILAIIPAGFFVAGVMSLVSIPYINDALNRRKSKLKKREGSLEDMVKRNPTPTFPPLSNYKKETLVPPTYAAFYKPTITVTNPEEKTIGIRMQ